MRSYQRPGTRERQRTPAPLALVAVLGVLGCGGDEEPERQETVATAAEIPAPAFPSVSDSLLLAGAGEDWPTHGGTFDNHRYSPLQQIGRGNVHELVPVWIHSTGIEGAFETTPIVVGNTMYVTTAGGRVLALNAATGSELWEYRPEPSLVTLCCGPTNQGVSVYDQTVYVATLDARLVALDARTGEPVWEQRLAAPADGYSITMAPLAADGRVYVGVTGERYGIRGFMAAFDGRSGDEIWRWHTVPDDSVGWWGEWSETDPFGTPLNRDIVAEREDSARTNWSWTVGGGGIATTPAYDPESNRLFVNVEGPAPMIGGGVRPGDNLYTGSIVGLDAGTGDLVWHAQYLPHDVWGLSGGSPPILFDRGSRRYVAFAGRTGWVYVFDAASGQPVLRSDNFVPQEGLFSPIPDSGGVRMAPGANGGNAGSPMAYDPGTGHVFVGGVHQPMVYSSGSQAYAEGQLWLGGGVRFPPDEAQWGTVTAIDLGDGELVWQVRTPSPVHSGVLATAGGLVFVGEGKGTLDALDAATGELLWQFDTGAGVHGSPVTYAVAGVQYVVAPAGGSHHFDTPAGDDLIAFALSSRRPATRESSYPTADYERGGPAVAGRRGVRQVHRDSVGPAVADTAADTARGDVDAASPGG